jgi:hypothetical protein
MAREKIRIGCGAGFSGDRFEPSRILLENGKLDYLVLECLAERTIALAQKRKKGDPSKGYDPLLERRIEDLLPLLITSNTKLISNMGAANPEAGARKIIEIAKKLQMNVKVAVVLGDNVLDKIQPDHRSMESGELLSSYGNIISANAYMGIESILPALESNAQIILTGRVADPSLFLAPMVHEFDWSPMDYNLLGKGTVLGHLLECAGQITGGYFADPISKPIPNIENLGHPFVELSRKGEGFISKVKGTGGQVTVRTAKEQLLYEVIDPQHYITPDVVADFSSVSFEELEKDQVLVLGGSGITKPEELKVSVGYEAGWLGEGEISYAGAHAVERAKLAGEIIQKRIGHLYSEFRIDYIGLSAMHGEVLSSKSNPYEVRLRVAGKTKNKELANLIGEEVEALYTNGPAGGGGARKNTSEIIGVVSILMDRNKIKPEIKIFEI